MAVERLWTLVCQKCGQAMKYVEKMRGVGKLGISRDRDPQVIYYGHTGPEQRKGCISTVSTTLITTAVNF